MTSRVHWRKARLGLTGAEPKVEHLVAQLDRGAAPREGAAWAREGKPGPRGRMPARSRGGGVARAQRAQVVPHQCDRAYRNQVRVGAHRAAARALLPRLAAGFVNSDGALGESGACGGPTASGEKQAVNQIERERVRAEEIEYSKTKHHGDSGRGT